MHTRARFTVLASVLLAGAAACTDVTVEPKSTVSSANIFNDTTSYRALLAKLYGGLQVSGIAGPAGSGDIQGIDEGFSQYLRLLWQMQELPTDEAVIAWNDAGVQELNTQLWGSSNQFLVSMYYRIFYQVSLANEFLRETTPEKLAARNTSASLTSTIKTYRAEARFLRALSYWHAVDLFGAVPLVKEDTPLNSAPPAQATRADIYNYVVSELTAIRADLPAMKQGEYGRADQGAVAMLLAKLYLNANVYTGTAAYPSALAEVQRIIASGAYSLDPNFSRMFRADNNTSPELIYTIPQDGLRTQSYGGTTFLTHAATGNALDPAVVGIEGGWYGLRVRPEVVNLYPTVPTGPDRRASLLFTTGQTLNIANITDFGNGILAPKYINRTSTGGAPSNNAFADVDYPMFRLGDVYLMYAEAVLRGGGGDRATALGYVNALRQRAYGNTSGNVTDAQLTLPFLLDERARELLWEGHRRTDLTRFDRFTANGVWQWKGNVQTGRTTEVFRNLYPLPASELLANPNLKQNTGY